jgi:hypothetical protein
VVEANPDEGGESNGAATGEGHDAFTSIRSFLLTSSDDVFMGDSRPNEVHGEGGDDLIEGAGNADRLRDGKGADTLRGQKGEDFLRGSDDGAVDKLNGGKNSDVCETADEDDEVKACEAF